MEETNFSLLELVRDNVKRLTPYSSARDEFSGEAAVFLDANENPFENGVNRYPDPLQKKLKNELANLKSVQAEQILLGNGSDEIIDLLLRAFCEPNKDNVIICPPTYGMYEVAAGINAVQVKEVVLDSDFQPDVEAILKASDQNSKLLFLCSPNNPTANLVEEQRTIELLKRFSGIVVVDEAYIDFAKGKTLLKYFDTYPKLVILQTLSKAWGMAGIRLGIGFASKQIIEVLNRIKPPYNVNSLTQGKAMELLKEEAKYGKELDLLLKERETLMKFCRGMNFVKKQYPSDANFLLLKVDDAKNLCEFLREKGIIIRDRSKMPLLDQCVRISIGTREENKMLCDALQAYKLER